MSGLSRVLFKAGGVELHLDTEKKQPLDSGSDIARLGHGDTYIKTPSPELVAVLATFYQDSPQEEHLSLLATAAQVALYENTARWMYGSQLRFLCVVSLVDEVPIDLAIKSFEAAQEADKEWYKGIRFDEWMKFLLARNLVTTGDGKVKITQYGLDFLTFLSGTGSPHMNH